jgi:hypothetical protein
MSINNDISPKQSVDLDRNEIDILVGILGDIVSHDTECNNCIRQIYFKVKILKGSYSSYKLRNITDLMKR